MTVALTPKALANSITLYCNIKYRFDSGIIIDENHPEVNGELYGDEKDPTERESSRGVSSPL